VQRGGDLGVVGERWAVEIDRAAKVAVSPGGQHSLLASNRGGHIRISRDKANTQEGVAEYRVVTRVLLLLLSIYWEQIIWNRR